jgi:hypothetical protein
MTHAIREIAPPVKLSTFQQIIVFFYCIETIAMNVFQKNISHAIISRNVPVENKERLR